MKIVSQRSAMPFDNRGSYGNPSISPTTQKSVMPFNNVLTIQDVVDGKKSIRDFYPDAGGNWGKGEDVDHNYREDGDGYKRQERDLEIIKNMLEKKDHTQQEWKVKVPGGSKSFISFDLASKYIRENKLPFSYISRVAQSTQGLEDRRVGVIADALNSVFKVESINVERGVIESGSAFCVKINHFLTCAHVIKKYNKNQKTDVSLFLGANVSLIHNGLRQVAKVVGVDPLLDIAMLECEIEAKPFEIDMDIQIGEEIVAIGSPHGYENNVSSGTIGSLGHKVYFYAGAPDYMFVDLSVFPGNSGGPVIKVSNGKVVGLVTLILSAEGGYGLNAALPSQYINGFLS